MIAITLSILAYLCAQGGAGEAAAEAPPPRVRELYDMRWFHALRAKDPMGPDLWRRGAIDFHDVLDESEQPLYEHGISEQQLAEWARVRVGEVELRSARSGDAGWWLVEAIAEGHARLREDLARLRERARTAVRVRFARLDPSADLSTLPVVLDADALEQLLADVSIVERHEATTLPGRGALLHERDWSALLADHDAESFSPRPRLDPQVLVQRSGAELLAIPRPDPAGGWDLEVHLQDVDALPSRTEHYPLGREPMELPASRWLTWRTAARVPSGGGLLLVADVDGRRERWLVTAEAARPSPAESPRLLPLGRLGRDALRWLPASHREPAPAGGIRTAEGDRWPYHPVGTEHDAYTDFVAGLRDAHAEQPGALHSVVPRLGPWIDVGRDDFAARATRSRVRRAARSFPTYQVEWLATRERLASPRSDVPATESRDDAVRAAVRAGDSLVLCVLEERTYLHDADIEIGSSAQSPDPKQRGISEGVACLVRVFPTRSDRVDVTCRWERASAPSPMESLDFPLGGVAPDYGRSRAAGEPVLISADESVRLEFPQQSKTAHRARFLAAPGEWELVGSAPVAATAGELSVWIRVTKLSD